MNFDRLAPFYDLIEALTTGSQMQRGRVAHLAEVNPAKRVLIVGEGNGRFLAACTKNSESSYTVIDESPAMLRLAAARWKRAGGNSDQVEFICTNLLDWKPREFNHDLIVSHYFFDCFEAKTIPLLVAKLTSLAAPNARWLFADFYQPDSGLTRIRSKLMLRIAYALFQRLAAVPARQLTVPDKLLSEFHWTLEKRILLNWKLIHSDLWRLTNV